MDWYTKGVRRQGRSGIVRALCGTALSTVAMLSAGLAGAVESTAEQKTTEPLDQGVDSRIEVAVADTSVSDVSRTGAEKSAVMVAQADTGSATEAPAAPGATQLDTVQVTGSRIKRDEFSSSSPISSFNRGDVDFSGAVSIDEFLKDVPAFTGFQLNTSTNNGGDGNKKVDLRGLGFNRTLVLINGRRQIGDVSGFGTADGAVDLNTIPDAMIERVEILKDGASTIYGSDALSGVVNIILKDKFEGVEFRANYGAGTEDGQAENKGWSVLVGSTSSRGNVVMSLGYSQQKEMVQAERPWAQFDLYPLLNANGVFEATPSGSSNSRRIRVDTDGNGTFDGSFIVDAVSGQARTFAPSDTYNFAPVNALITPNERYQAGALGSIDITDNVDGYFEALYTRRTSHQRLAPDASFAVDPAFATPNNGAQWNDFVPASNPFNPFGVNPRNGVGLSNLDVRINRRFVESGGRIFLQTADTFRFVSGLNGEVMNTGVNWDLSYIFAQNAILNETKNYHRFDRWAIAVDPAACAADAACTAAGGVLNPFDDYGSITAAQMAYLSTGSLKDHSTGQLNMLSLNFGGRFGALPGGGIGWAAGIERRKEQGVASPDEFSASGLTTGGASDPLSGSFEVEEFYGELLLPVLDTLNVEVSARHSDYNTSAGSKTTYKVGADYQPVPSLLLRTGYATGFRAPNIAELNQGERVTFPIVEPVCEFGDRRLAAGQMTATAYANCQAMVATDGVDTTDAGEFGFAWQSAQTFLAPASPLKPEESKNFQFGVVFTPEAVKGLSLGIDYWSIEIENVIGTDDPNDISTACINSPGMTDPSCTAFVTGQPYDGPFPADLTTPFGNLGNLKTAGLDFNALYEGSLNLGIINKYHLLWGATYVDTFERTFSLSGTRELVGTANGFAVYPEWRWNTEAGVSGNGWTAAWQMRFIGETEDFLRPSSITNDAVAESIVYHDLVGSYTWRNVSIHGGINNFTDEDPPSFHSAFNAETEPGMYDVIGRRLFAGVKVSF